MQGIQAGLELKKQLLESLAKGAPMVLELPTVGGVVGGTPLYKVAAADLPGYVASSSQHEGLSGAQVSVGGASGSRRVSGAQQGGVAWEEGAGESGPEGVEQSGDESSESGEEEDRDIAMRKVMGWQPSAGGAADGDALTASAAMDVSAIRALSMSKKGSKGRSFSKRKSTKFQSMGGRSGDGRGPTTSNPGGDNAPRGRRATIASAAQAAAIANLDE